MTGWDFEQGGFRTDTEDRRYGSITMQCHWDLEPGPQLDRELDDAIAAIRQVYEDAKVELGRRWAAVDQVMLHNSSDLSDMQATGTLHEQISGLYRARDRAKRILNMLPPEER